MPEPIKVEIVETQGSPTPEPQKPVVKEKEEPKYVRVEDLEKVNQAINNTRDYHNRRFNEVMEKLERLTPKPVEKTPDDLDELVQKDWKMGVRKVAEQLLEERSAKTQVESQEQLDARIRQENINMLMDKHKELNDPSSEKSLEFKKILAEKPHWTTNPEGPRLTMIEMENRLNARGNINSGGDKMKEARSRATSVPAGTSPGNKTAYSLSKQDLDFCRLNGIRPENYKMFKGMREVQA